MSSPVKIQRLDEVVVNRIAAGEVIQRPANALKELLENSIDAKATNISILVKAGGLKLLQIQDNGTGIRRDDLEIVCERFTTSKLTSFEDLNSICTYGFRGEALASISHVAHLTITTKTKSEKCAFRASYSDGKLTGKPQPCAGNQGTQITVEDLFYNVSTRKAALKNPNDEYNKIYSVVSKYAIHNSHIGFTLKKSGENSNDLKTSPKSSYINNIRSIYGNALAKELIEFEMEDSSLVAFKVHAFVTNANFSSKKPSFILFINHRLIDSTLLRKSLENIYSQYLPKHSHPFIYLSLEIDPQHCDVNVHPTKSEVHFLHEEAIIELIRAETEKQLLGSNKSRTFYTRKVLTNISDESLTESLGKTQLYQKDLVRTDSNEQKLEQFFSQVKTKPSKIALLEHNTKPDKVEVTLLSVLESRKKIELSCDHVLRQIFAQHKFVGCVDEDQSLIQHDTKLYLIDTSKLCEELFYQFIMFDFQNFDQIVLEKPLSIYDQIRLLINLNLVENYNEKEDGSPHDLAKMVENFLLDKKEMLNAYFAFEIDDSGCVVGIPMLLENYMPDLTNLPLLLFDLIGLVDWETEEGCFETFSRQLAKFYANIAIKPFGNDLEYSWKWAMEYAVFPALKRFLLPPLHLRNNGSVVEIVNLPSLYHVFERC